MFRLILIAVLVNAAIDSMAQRANFWYFGDSAGVQFANDTFKKVLTDGALFTYEGVSSIANMGGQNLLFYSDGRKVYDSRHMQMPNGFDLFGSWTTTQSCLIVPYPGSNNLYYVFTTNTDESIVHKGLNYSIVDMDLNQGFGDVSIKNQLLVYNNSEKLNGIGHGNGLDYWVATYNRNDTSLYAYLISDTGISAPVISRTSSPHKRGGQMKFSITGTQFASSCSDAGGDTLVVYNFNNVSGRFTNPVYLPLEGIDAINSYRLIYGIEFSPNDSLLYITYMSQSGTNYDDLLIQFDLFSGTPNDILSNAKIIPIEFDGVDKHLASLQLGPDGKIYVSVNDASGFGGLGSTHLGRINYPNSKGILCDFEFEAIMLENRIALWGLPNFVQSFLVDVPMLYSPYDTFVDIGNDVNGNTKLLIYPNPNNGACTIELPDHYGSINLKVFDSFGRLVDTKTFLNSKLITYYLSGASGIYFLQLTLDTGESIYFKAIKE